MMHLQLTSRLEYSVAFDLAAAALERQGMPPAGLAVLTAPIFAWELLMRSRWRVSMWTTSAAASGVRAAYRELREQTPPPGCVEILPDDLQPVRMGRYHAALWAAPDAASWPAMLHTIDLALEPDGILCIVGAGGLSRWTRPLRRSWTPGEPDLPITGATGLLASLQQRSYHIAQLVGFGSLASIGWAVAARVAARADRPDLEDRCQAAYRRSLLRPAARGLGSSMVLAICRKGSAP